MVDAVPGYCAAFSELSRLISARMRRIGRSTRLFLSLPAVISQILAAIPAGIPRTTTRNGAKLMEFSYARIERSGTVSINNLLSSIVDCSWRVVH